MSLRPRNKKQEQKESAMKWQLEFDNWYASLKSFNAEPEWAAMHEAN